MTVHHCHAFQCLTKCQPRMLMCPKHWRMVPTNLKHDLLEAYVPGQERNWAKLSHAYLNAAADCVRAVAYIENADPDIVEADHSVSGYLAFIDMSDPCGDPTCRCAA